MCVGSHSSSIFEAMLSLPPGDKQAEVVMELSDKLFEDAQTLRSFLSLIYDMKLDFPISWDHGKREYLEWRDRLTNLLTFMDKYNSEKGYKLLRLWSNHAQQAQSWSPHGAFVFGAMTNDIHMCVKALEDSTSDSWRPDDSSPIGARRLHLFQLGAAPYDFFCSIPPQYAFALARAGVTAEPGSDAFRDEFVTTVTAALKAKGEPSFDLC